VVQRSPVLSCFLLSRPHDRLKTRHTWEEVKRGARGNAERTGAERTDRAKLGRVAFLEFLAILETNIDVHPESGGRICLSHVAWALGLISPAFSRPWMRADLEDDRFRGADMGRR
jgi:hypothetical protein